MFASGINHTKDIQWKKERPLSLSDLNNAAIEQANQVLSSNAAIDLEGIKSFLVSFGLKVECKVLMIDILKASELDRPSDAMLSFLQTNCLAAYMSNLDQVWVKVHNQLLETPEWSEQRLAERLIGHELVHAGGKLTAIGVVKTDNADIMYTSTGFSKTRFSSSQKRFCHDLRSSGDFIEEGIAEYFPTLYYEETVRNLPKNIAARLFGDQAVVPLSTPMPMPNGAPVLLKYMTIDAEGPSLALPSYPALTLELISRYEEDLIPSIIDSRQDPSKQAAVIKIINRVKPNLYTQLIDVPNNLDAYRAKYTEVYNIFN